MADVRPFRGVRYAAASLGCALCPPYDVISAELAKKLRRVRSNAVFLELPEGSGDRRYARAAGVWRRWIVEGLLVRDPQQAFYAVEESFRWNGRVRVRRGFLGALSVEPKHARDIIPHERTLAKPKADRLKMLDQVGVNTSPIFGVYGDPSGAARRALARAMRGRPAATGRSHAGVDYRLWVVEQAGLISSLRKALSSRSILIADGHHRFAVSGDYHRRTGGPGSGAVLTYFVADEDDGLVVLPTHRIAKRPLRERAAQYAGLTLVANLAELNRRVAESENPYAFGLIENGFYFGEPKPNACRSGLAVEWLAAHLLAEIAPDQMSYTPDSAVAAKAAESAAACAVLVKPFGVAQVRRAAKTVGLLPQKSTYFFPKIATGLVFRSLDGE
ncbi:MAG: DUF1015 domain-containing protein [Elusimicrobiota bacterium]